MQMRCRLRFLTPSNVVMGYHAPFWLQGQLWIWLQKILAIHLHAVLFNKIPYNRFFGGHISTAGSRVGQGEHPTWNRATSSKVRLSPCQYPRFAFVTLTFLDNAVYDSLFVAKVQLPTLWIVHNGRNVSRRVRRSYIT